MDEELQGTKGKEIVYVDSVGNVIETEKKTDAVAGNDLYLTIDKNLQEATYQIIEEKLAGILVSRIQNIMNYDPASAGDSSKIIIPIDDVYHALFANEVIDKKDVYKRQISDGTAQNTSSGILQGDGTTFKWKRCLFLLYVSRRLCGQCFIGRRATCSKRNELP